MKFNLPKLNSILIAICVVIVVIGFALMTGESSGATEFNPDIFSTRRIVVGPMISLFGFMMMIVAILYKPRKKGVGGKRYYWVLYRDLRSFCLCPLRDIWR